MANANSFGGAYKKSIRRAIFFPGNFAITNVFDSPQERTSKIIPVFNKSLTNFLYTTLVLPVIITSISPEVC